MLSPFFPVMSAMAEELDVWRKHVDSRDDDDGECPVPVGVAARDQFMFIEARYPCTAALARIFQADYPNRAAPRKELLERVPEAVHCVY